MPQYAFGEYRFDTKTFQLWKNKSNAHLRPKAAELLVLFILHKGRVLSKTVIAQAIWKQESVPDHTLFQLISELRKLSSTTIIRTHPNQGYCWIAPTKIIEKNTYRSAILALCTAASIASLILISSHISPPNNAAPLPSHKAFIKGLVALERGDNKNATSWLTFALTENPSSIETRLFLAESLFQQSRLEESINYLTPILRQNNTPHLTTISPYSKAAANNLMSRIYQKDGKLLDALEYAQLSNLGQSNLGQTIAHCTEDIIDQRVEQLTNILGIHQTHEATATVTTPETNAPSTNEHYAEQCSQLKALNREPSACKDSKHVEFYALNSLFSQRRKIV